MASRRMLNRFVDQRRRAERQRFSLTERVVPREPRRPSIVRPESIHPLLAKSPDLDAADVQQAIYEQTFNLEQPCARCGHELGFHRFTTFDLPTPCGCGECQCPTFIEEPVMQSIDPFAGVPSNDPVPELPPGEPMPLDDLEPDVEPTEDPDSSTKQDAQDTILDLFSAPVGAADPDPATTSVVFPIAQQGQSLLVVDALEAPARRVAEIVDALAPLLAPPAAVAELVQLVERANALVVTDAASYQTCTDLYEQLAANEKYIEEGPIGAVVAWFHRPWKAFCEFRARFRDPVIKAKQRLSDLGGAWKLEDDRRAAAEARRVAEEAAAAERAALAETARIAREQVAAAQTPAAKEHAEQVAAVVEQAAADVRPAVIPARTFATAPATSTKNRKSYEIEIVDVDAFYRALVEDPTRRIAAPIDLAYLKRQAVDMGVDIKDRFPGIEAREKGGLTAGGRR